MKQRSTANIDQCQKTWPAKKILWFSVTFAFHLACAAGSEPMVYDDYLRGEAAKYRKLAEQAPDEQIKKELYELAAVCEEVANNIEDRMTAG
jgi:hypothetical protein